MGLRHSDFRIDSDDLAWLGVMTMEENIGETFWESFESYSTIFGCEYYRGEGWL